jgi:hypothetical protein
MTVAWLLALFELCALLMVRAGFALSRSAARLAHETGAALTLMHVLPGGALQELRQWLGTGHATERQLHDDAQRQLRALAAELQVGRHVTASAVSASGSVLDEIGCGAEALDAALLVLGGARCRGDAPAGVGQHVRAAAAPSDAAHGTARQDVAVQRVPGAVRGEAPLRGRRRCEHRSLPATGPRRRDAA